MKLTFISDTEPIIGKAVAIAANLKRAGLIQLYNLSEEVSGVDVVPYPPTADCVRDKGGWDAYAKEIHDKFAGLGFKPHVKEEDVEQPPDEAA